MASPPSKQFGKRQPAVPASPSPPVKRSRHVALLLTGSFAVGGAAYALMPHERCQPASPTMAAPLSPTPGVTAAPSPTTTGCGSQGYSGGHGGSGGYWSRRTSFFGGDSASSSGASSASSAGETSRGGFGSFARAIGAHFSGG